MKLSLIVVPTLALAAVTAHASCFTKGGTPLNLPGTCMPANIPEPPQSSELHKAWEKASTLNQIKPVLKVNKDKFHGPSATNRVIEADSSTNGVSISYTGNWSGSAVQGTANNVYGTGAIGFNTTIPNVVMPLGNTCAKNTSAQNTSSQVAIWAGFDGFTNATVEQAGINIVTYCEASPPPNLNYAWIEAYPNPEIEVSNFPIKNGDITYTWVTIEQSSKEVCATWLDVQQNNTTSACITAPEAFSANSFEFIVEAPTGGTQQIPLANYVQTILSFTNVWDWKTGTFYGSGTATPQDWGASGSFYYVYMEDANGIISSPNPRYPDTLIMYNTGDSYCTPNTNCVTQFGYTPN